MYIVPGMTYMFNRRVGRKSGSESLKVVEAMHGVRRANSHWFVIGAMTLMRLPQV